MNAFNQKFFFLSPKSITSWESIVKFPMDQSKEISGVLASKKVAFGARALMEIHVYCGLPTICIKGGMNGSSIIQST